MAETLKIISPEQGTEVAKKVWEETGEVVLSGRKLNSVLKELYDMNHWKEFKSFHSLCEKEGSSKYNLSKLLNPPKAQKEKAPAPEFKQSDVVPQQNKTHIAASIASVVSEDAYIPAEDDAYIEFGHHKMIKKIIASGRFFPLYLYGLSGNGKTIMVEQCCYQAQRHYIRVQIHAETCEDDLIGGLRIIKGETVFADGPVIKAMRQGAVLLIDELDRGSNNLLCLQGILEGKPYMIKKTGEVVVPAKGFTVIGTANTKGRGDETDMFAARILDEALLERFKILLEQEYPDRKTELKIFRRKAELEGCDFDPHLLTQMTVWTETLRKSYEERSIENFVSTRRACGIIETYSILGNINKSVELCTNRFEKSVSEAMMKFWEVAINSKVTEVLDDASSDKKKVNDDDDIPF